MRAFCIALQVVIWRLCCNASIIVLWLLSIFVALSNIACSTPSMAVKYPHIRIERVCVRPYGIEPDATHWVFAGTNHAVSNYHTEEFDFVARSSSRMYEYSPDADPRSVRQLPSPHNDLTCPERFSPLASSPEEEASLPPESIFFAETDEPCDEQANREHAVRGDSRFLGQSLGPISRALTTKRCLEQRFGVVKEPAPAPQKAPPQPDEPPPTGKDHPVAQFMGGAAAGAAIGTVPGGSIGAQVAIDRGVLPQGTRAARIGKGVGEIGSGLVQIGVGASGAAGGAALSVTGPGALVGVPAMVTSAGLIVNGAAATAVGVINTAQALSTGSGNDGSPPSASAPPNGQSASSAATSAAPAAKAASARAPSGAKAVTNATGTVTTRTWVKTTGQEHHAISKTIHKALERHPRLRGVYKERDPRFVTRAITPEAHRGYQKWHIRLDKEIAKWIDDNQAMTPKDFEVYLRNRYAASDLVAIFPNGF